MALPEVVNEGELKVLESKNFCYFSNFDLNINDWFIEYENLEIFKMNVKKNLAEKTQSDPQFPLTFPA